MTMKLTWALALGTALVSSAAASEASARTLYLSPSGNDGQAGSQSAPWRTFAHAISALQAGDTLVLLDGVYQSSTTGYPQITCGTNANNGVAGQPITLRAQNERKAFIKGNSSVASPFKMLRCAYWNVEGLRVESGDFSTQTTSGAIIAVTDSNNIVLRRNLARFNNRYANHHAVMIYRSKSVLVEESEIYSYHRHGFGAFSSSNVTFRSNYANSRAHADLEGGWRSAVSKHRGDSGFIFYPGSDGLVENCISEGNDISFRVIARYGESDNNRFYGSISLTDIHGTILSTHDGAYQPDDTYFENIAFIRPYLRGIYAQGSINTRCNNCSVFSARNDKSVSVHAMEWPGQPGPSINYSFFADNLLAVSGASRGILITDHPTWRLDHVNSWGHGGTNFSPGQGDSRYVSAASVDPKLGGCLVRIPDSSPMKGSGVGGADIGANVLYKYQNGVLTNAPMWDKSVDNGRFVGCGAIVPGVNDVAGSSCIDVHKRLNVNRNGCSLPSGYPASAESAPAPTPEPTPEPVCSDCPTEIEAPFAQTTPTVDGHCGEYAGVTPASISNGQESGTYAVAWDLDALYLCGDVADGDLQASGTGRDAASFWGEDAVEIVFDTTHDGGGSMGSGDFKFAVNILGTEYDADVQGSGWNGEWMSAVSTDGTVGDTTADNGYGIELKIPWSTLGVAAPTAGSRWGFDVNLNEANASSKSQTAWRNANGGSFNDPDGWGDLVFTGEPAATPPPPAPTCDEVTACADGDTCCPSGCDHTSDNDCSPPVATPGTCEQVTACIDNDGCCPENCLGSDLDCSVTGTVSCTDDGQGGKVCNVTDLGCSETATTNSLALLPAAFGVFQILRRRHRERKGSRQR